MTLNIKPREIFLATEQLDAYSDKTEPARYPHLYTSLVKKSDFDRLKTALDKAIEMRDREIQMRFSHSTCGGSSLIERHNAELQAILDRSGG
jgi:hypothetical protein